ncbi:MAG: retropepsin-like aspartic protease [Anaerolineales bacterium]
MSEIALQIKPDEQTPEAAEVLVQGAVGDRAYRFLLDTGAAHSCLLYDDYSKRFQSREKEESSGLFGGSRYDLIDIPSIELGPIKRKPFTLHRQSPDAAVQRNLIGMDLLKEHRCHFLFSRDALIIDPAASVQLTDELVPLTMDRRFHPYLEIAVGEGHGNATWDTGAGITVVDTVFIHEHPERFKALEPSLGTDSAGETRQTPMFTMQGLRLQGLLFPSHTVAGVDLSHVNRNIETPMDMILGYSSLRLADWYFDFPRRKWKITRMIDAGKTVP